MRKETPNLGKVLNRLLVAVAEGDCASDVVARNLRFTINAETHELSALLSRTGRSPREYNVQIFDENTQQAAFFTLIALDGSRAWLGGRLKASAGKVVELETLLVTRDFPFQSVEPGEPSPLWQQEVPPSERRSRQQCIDLANAYFDGVEANSSGQIPFAADCNRFENGFQLTNNPDLGWGGAFNVSALDCKGHLDSQFFSYIARITPRRFVAVDERRGAIFAILRFQCPGIRSTLLPGHGEYIYNDRLSVPQSVLVFYAMKVRDGMLQRLEALIMRGPFGAGTGWDDDSG